MSSSTEDLYQVLGITPSATPAEIEQAYRTLLRRHRSLKGAKRDDPYLQEIERAYQVLIDPERRETYDSLQATWSSSGDTPFTFSILSSHEQLPVRFDEQMLYALVGIRPSQDPSTLRLPLNLALIIDRSTSMKGERLDYVKAAAHQILDDMQDDDTLGVIVFSDRAEIIVPSQKLIDRPRIHARISSIWTSGGTEMFQGLEQGLDQVNKFHSQNTISHVILLTDGHTYGDEDKCLEAAEEAGQESIGISALGIGEDWNDTFLEQLVRHTGGTCTYISHPRQVRQVLQQQIRGLSSIVARDMKLKLGLTDKVLLENVYACTPEIEQMEPQLGVINLGLLNKNSWVQLLMELVVKQHPIGIHNLANMELEGMVPALGRRQSLPIDLTMEFVTEPDERQIPTAIINTLNKVSLYRLQEQAWQDIKDGKAEVAGKRLEAVATRLLDLGETELARLAMIEASRVAQGRQATGKGHKSIKYGTRALGVDN